MMLNVTRVAKTTLSGHARVIFSSGVRTQLRLNSTKTELSNEPKRHTTVLSKNFTDPERNSFFEYSWGTWLHDDAGEKLKRRTTFVIEGLNDLLRELYEKSHGEFAKEVSITSDKVITEQESACESLDFLKFPNINVLKHNCSVSALGELNPNETLNTKEISSIHEGKHHRIYKITTNSDREFVLRLPYQGIYAAKGLEAALTRKIQSEVATLDLISKRVPTAKVIAYSTDANNCLEFPFILMEFVKGDPLIRQWNPLSDDQMEVKKVVDNIMNVNYDAALSIDGLQAFGSIYFKHDLPEGISAFKEESPYVIGPIAEVDQHLGDKVGPWRLEEPLKIIEDLASNLSEHYKDNAKAKAVYDNLQTVAPHLFNVNSEILPNFSTLFEPKLYIPDLDPINILQDGETFALLDVEESSVKPFILHSYPKFIKYDGPKLFTKEELDEVCKETEDEELKLQYEYMFMRTRNQFLWEFALNNKKKELIGAISPAVKMIKSGYIQAVENPDNYLVVERCLIDLAEMWEGYAQHKLVLSETLESPIKYTREENEQNVADLQAKDVALSKPFALTDGWIPQDLFEKLYAQGVIKDGANGDYEVDVEKALEDIDLEGLKAEESKE